MKASIFSLALVAGLAAAQSDKIPSCATSCISKYTTGDGIAGCGQLDIKCICSNDDFLNGIACCLKDKCDTAGQAAAVKYAQQICSTAGVTVPDEVTCKESSSSASASASSASASASAKASAASKSVSEMMSSATEAETATDMSASATTAVESSGTATGSSSAASSTSSGAAMAGLDTAGGVMGAIMALLFAL
jgi:cobalamin biosynthesis Mg chelatase CobN